MDRLDKIPGPARIILVIVIFVALVLWFAITVYCMRWACVQRRTPNMGMWLTRRSVSEEEELRGEEQTAQYV